MRPLTTREREVVSEIRGGKSNKLIAFDMGLSEWTVKNHIARIFRKLGVNSRLQVALHEESRKLEK